MLRSDYETNLRKLLIHAWDHEVVWEEIEAWIENFKGQVFAQEDEELYALFALTRFMYFGKRLVREMLKSLYRDHFESPLMQRIRRHLHNTRDSEKIRSVYKQELASTRFIGLGNPAESGAHLLYYFRQINYLEKGLFVDLAGAFIPTIETCTGKLLYKQTESNVTSYVFFDDLVGSGTQATQYLSNRLKEIRAGNPNLELRLMSLFATTQGLEKMNAPHLFNGQAMCLFELDQTYKAFDSSSRYFANAPEWFDPLLLCDMFRGYGQKLLPSDPLGYKDGQLLLGFSHNIPDNAPPVFWDEGKRVAWSPVFMRYDKKYKENA